MVLGIKHKKRLTLHVRAYKLNLKRKILKHIIKIVTKHYNVVFDNPLFDKLKIIGRGRKIN